MATSTKPPNFTDLPLTPVNGSQPPGSDRSWHEWMMLGVVLTAGLALVAIIASVIALSNKTTTTTTVIRQGASSAGQGTASAAGAAGRNTSGMGSMLAGARTTLGSGSAVAGAGAVIPIVLQKDASSGIPGTITGKGGWPRYSPSSISVPAGRKVTLVITNYDDVATPLTGGLPYNHVMGGSETVNGKPVHYVGNRTIAHTLTVTGLGLNVAIPKAPAGGAVTITFTFIAHKAGTYTWQCYSPCGAGKNGTGGPMMTNGFMQGRFTVV